MLPVDKVAAPRVSPMHMPPIITVGVMLIKEMKPSVVKDRPVWVVHPQGRRKEMVARSSRIGVGTRDGGSNALVGLVDRGGRRRFHRLLLAKDVMQDPGVTGVAPERSLTVTRAAASTHLHSAPTPHIVVETQIGEVSVNASHLP